MSRYVLMQVNKLTQAEGKSRPRHLDRPAKYSEESALAEELKNLKGAIDQQNTAIQQSSNAW